MRRAIRGLPDVDDDRLVADVLVARRICRRIVRALWIEAVMRATATPAQGRPS